MAEVTLGQYELERGAIPNVCLVCGGAASQKVTRTFAWRPAELLSVSNSLINMTLDVPVCAKHRSHWSRQVIFDRTIWTMLLLTVVIVELFFPVRADISSGIIMGVLGLSTFLLAASWLLINMWFDFTMVKPTEITARAITLANVSQEFVAQLEAMRQTVPNQSDTYFDPHHEPQALRKPLGDGSFRAGSQ